MVSGRVATTPTSSAVLEHCGAPGPGVTANSSGPRESVGAAQTGAGEQQIALPAAVLPAQRESGNVRQRCRGTDRPGNSGNVWYLGSSVHPRNPGRLICARAIEPATQQYAVRVQRLRAPQVGGDAERRLQDPAAHQRRGIGQLGGHGRHVVVAFPRRLAPFTQHCTASWEKGKSSRRHLPLSGVNMVE